MFAAAATEFAARGFAGANVDRIAAAARLNKAMIYYHFHSKAALYREILRDMFGAVARRRRAPSPPPTLAPADKIRAFIATIATEARGAAALSRRSGSARSPKAAATSTPPRSAT